VRYVRERFFKGGSFRDLEDCRQQAEHWCSEVAGLRVHGTTRQLPRAVFEAEEQPKLQPYEGVAYDVPLWREVTVHPDHHVQFEQALYSAPVATCPPGTKLEVSGGQQLVKLSKKGELVKVHPRQARGARATDPEDYPQEKTPYALRATDRVIQRAAPLGPNVEAFATKLFEGPLPWAKLRAGLKLVSLGERYGGERLDAACGRALAYGLILADEESLPSVATTLPSNVGSSLPASRSASPSMPSTGRPPSRSIAATSTSSSRSTSSR